MGDAAPLIPIFATYPVVLLQAHHGQGAASGQEPSELPGASAKEPNKGEVALFSYTSASCCFGDFAAWEEKLGKPAVPPAPPSHHACLEKKKRIC